MLDPEEFIASCQQALSENTPAWAIKELVGAAVAEPDQIVAAWGIPSHGGITTLHRSPELTILNIVWPPGMALYPHDHQLWAVIGLYGGQEDNTFFNRKAEGVGLIRAGFKELRSRNAVILGQDAIHAVHNPQGVFTGALHVYGGDFFAQPRSEWASENDEEIPYSVDHAMKAFADANGHWLAQQEQSSRLAKADLSGI